jgi:hypothetical protein
MIWVEDGELRIEDGTTSVTSGVLTAILHPPSSILDRRFPSSTRGSQCPI